MTALSDSGGHTASLLGGFAAWLQTRSGYERAQVVECRRASVSNGYSFDTLKLVVERDGAPREQLILQIPPDRPGVHPPGDLAAQYRLMDGLGGVQDLPMACCRWYEGSREVLGRPFMVVENVDGLVPPDAPETYVAAGWVRDATTSERARMWDTTIDALGTLAKVDPYKVGLTGWPDRNRSCAAQHLDEYHRRFDWSRTELLPHVLPLYRELQGWLDAHVPPTEHIGVVWGDGRFGNIIYRDFQPVALLDWETVTMGDPESDIAYFLMMHEAYMRHETLRLGEVAPMTGFGTNGDAVERYASVSGRPVRFFDYYWLFNAYRLLVFTQRVSALQIQAGVLTVDQAEAARWMPGLMPVIEQRLG